MRRVLASVLCAMAASSLAPVLAGETTQITPSPIFIAMPTPASMPTILDNDAKDTDAKQAEQVSNTQDTVKTETKKSKKVATKTESKKEKKASRKIAQNTTGSSSDPNQPAKPTGSFPKTGISGQFEKIGKFGKSLPKRLPPTLVCTVGGTPIAFFRHTVSAIQEGVKDIVGESKFPLFVAPAVCVSFPYGLCAGVLAGPVVGLYNGWKYSDDKPFSKDAFSLGSDK